MRRSAPGSLQDMQACRRCPRLARHLDTQRLESPQGHNAPVSPWGAEDASVLIIGLAPGRLGANQSGLPFWGDHSGNLLMEALVASGAADPSIAPPRLNGVRLVNAVACLPPGNRPSATEIRTCGETWLRKELIPERVILCLGRVAHHATLRQLGESPSRFPFSHGATYRLDGRVLVSSYHPSPLNTRTGRLRPKDFIFLVGETLRMAFRDPPG